jgi:hypothetical protein
MIERERERERERARVCVCEVEQHTDSYLTINSNDHIMALIDEINDRLNSKRATKCCFNQPISYQSTSQSKHSIVVEMVYCVALR